MDKIEIKMANKNYYELKDIEAIKNYLEGLNRLKEKGFIISLNVELIPKNDSINENKGIKALI